MSNQIIIDFQFVLDKKAIQRFGMPDEAIFRKWIGCALKQIDRDYETELTLRVVTKAEIIQLNETYRNKAGPTNVLSFPFEKPIGVPAEFASENLLGDIILCAEVIYDEAIEQSKTLSSHWAHMVIHGVLHLCGYDHQSHAQALDMEGIEKTIMNTFGYTDPYKETNAL